MIWNDAPEKLKTKTQEYDLCWDFLGYTYCTIPFTVHTYSYGKQLVDVISNIKKPIAFSQGD